MNCAILAWPTGDLSTQWARLERAAEREGMTVARWFREWDYPVIGGMPSCACEYLRATILLVESLWAIGQTADEVIDRLWSLYRAGVEVRTTDGCSVTQSSGLALLSRLNLLGPPAEERAAPARRVS